MLFLSNHNLVHRDLAARNCLIDADLNVKVADFGLARHITDRDYYKSDKLENNLPVRWMAPESLQDLKYSVKSDVWTFGIVGT